jgi:hypothetical protein
MQHSDSNFARGHKPCSDNDGGSSIKPINIEERGKSVADDDGGRFIRTEAQRELKKYIGVMRSGRKWISRVCNGSYDDGTKIRIHLGTFPTAEMAAIAFDTAVFHLKGETSADRLNFPHCGSHIRSIVEGSSPSKSDDNVRKVAWEAAKALAPLISLENKDQGLHVSAIMSATSGATSALMISSNTGMDQI